MTNKINFKDIKVDIKQKDFSLGSNVKFPLVEKKFALDKAGRKSMKISSNVKFPIKEKSMKLD